MLLPLSDVLAFSGLTARQWETLVEARVYPAPPPVPVPRGPRWLTRDECVGAFIVAHFHHLGVPIAKAGKLAGEVQAQLARHGDELTELWVVVGPGDVPRYVTNQPPPAGAVAYVFPVGHLRIEVERFAHERGGGRPS
jgi:hypothetical protein